MSAGIGYSKIQIIRVAMSSGVKVARSAEKKFFAVLTCRLIKLFAKKFFVALTLRTTNFNKIEFDAKHYFASRLDCLK